MSAAIVAPAVLFSSVVDAGDDAVTPAEVMLAQALAPASALAPEDLRLVH